MENLSWLTNELIEKAKEIKTRDGSIPGRRRIQKHLGLSSWKARIIASILKTKTNNPTTEDKKLLYAFEHIRQITEKSIDGDGVITVSITPKNVQDVVGVWRDSKGIDHYGLTTEEELRAVHNIPDDYIAGDFESRCYPVGRKSEDGGPAIGHYAKQKFYPPPLKNWDKQLDQLSGLIPFREKVDPPWPQPGQGRRALEIDIMDPHITMQCFKPAADHDWNPELARKFYLWCLFKLLDKSEPFGPFEELIMPIGEDYLHTDGPHNRLASDRPMPDATDYYEGFVLGETLLIEALDMIRTRPGWEKTRIKLLVIPGNHSRQSDFAIGRVIRAAFRNDEMVEVDCSPSPIKLWHWGVCLVGFEHGRDIKPNRLASLMANEAKMRGIDWRDIKYAEWHQGDQHRKGSIGAISFEEQAVSVCYIMGLTPANAWSKSKSFNHQKRGAVAHIWDDRLGLEAQIPVHIDYVTGQPLGYNEVVEV